MLEGLEVNTVSIKECFSDNNCRLESDFWTNKTVSKTRTIKGGEIIDFVQYGTSKELNDENSGYPILRLNEFNSHFIGIPSKYCNLISTVDFERLKLKKGDVLICRTNGNPNFVGRSALVAEDTDFAYASYLFKIRPKTEIMKSATLVAFLSCKYGRIEIDRYSMTGNQTNFSPAKFKEINIPVFSKSFNAKMENTYYSAFEKLIQSQTLYRQAEELLLETIGLKDFQPSQENKNIKSFSESFLATGRLDAEYYQPKYEEIEKKIKQFPCELVGNICSNINYGTVPTSLYTENREGIPYIKGMNLKNLKITGTLDRIINTDELPDKFYTKTGDIVISQMGTVGDVGIITKKEENYLFASFTIRIRIKDRERFNPYYVGLYIQNIAKEWYLHRNIAQASVRQNTDLPTIKNMYIPIIEMNIQYQIAELIEKSFSLRKESELLLDEAKRMVEKEIENRD